MGTAGEDLVTNSVTYGKKRYATLDGTPPGLRTVASQKESLALPSGWSLAELSEGLIENVIKKFGWGTRRLVLSNGDTYATCLSSVATRSRVEQSNLQTDSQGKLSPRVLNQFTRVLICTAIPTDGSRHCVQTLANLWENQDFADCEVECDGEVFKCHRGLLAQASPVFKRMFSGEMKEAKARRVQVEIADTQAVSAFLKFIYTGTLNCEVDQTISVAKLADFYQVESLAKAACTTMLSEVDKCSVARICRFLQSTRERPDFASYWEELVKKVCESQELTRALMTDM